MDADESFSTGRLGGGRPGNLRLDAQSFLINTDGIKPNLCSDPKPLLPDRFGLLIEIFAGGGKKMFVQIDL